MSNAKISDPITFAEPIVRGEQTIEQIALRKPNAGELRGLSLQDLYRSNVSALIDLVPRIAVPPITEAEAAALEPSDIAACAGVVVDFLMTPAERARMELLLKG